MTSTVTPQVPRDEPAGDRFSDRVILPGGATLVVRPAVSDDVAPLWDLFDHLSSGDRYTRFFSAFRPDLAFVERILALPERGGRALVAEVSDGDEHHLIVAEADYVPLADGDAELSMVVADDWRGWLAPYLLDALVRAAADDGIPNLRAEVLASNEPMLRLLRARGAVLIDDEDWTTVTSTIGTTAIRIPTWPQVHDRPRVLVELCSGHWHASDAARAAGFDVITCPGPHAGRPECPVLAGRPCPLVEGADVVVVSKRGGEPVADELVDAHRDDRTRPLVIDVRSRTAPDDSSDADADAVALARPSAAQVVATLQSILDAPQDREGKGDGRPVDTCGSPSSPFR